MRVLVGAGERRGVIVYISQRREEGLCCRIEQSSVG
jgi:hypothetical protein